MAFGTMFIMSPICGWNLPLLTPILIATAGALGYRHLTALPARRRMQSQLEKQLQNRRTIELQLEEYLKGVVSEQLDYEEAIQFEKEDLVLTFGHDARGRFFIRVTGPKDRTTAELRYLGEEFALAVIQQFAYNRIAKELDRRGVHVVEETTDEEGNIILRTRRW